MATVVTYNGSSFTIPATGEENWGGATKVDGFLIEVANNAFQKAGGLFSLSGDVDFGPTAGLKSIYYKSRGTVSTAGVVRLAKAESIGWLNNAGSGNNLLTTDNSDNLLWNGVAIASSAGITPVAAGGTGIASYSTGDMLYASGATTLSKLAIGTVNKVQVSTGTAPSWALLVNANVDAAAAIAYSKLNLTGLVVNADIGAAAAIAYSKLNLTGLVVNADIGAAAAIAYSKLNLATSIVNADIAVGAAIALSKTNLLFTTYADWTEQGSTPASPAASTRRLYFKTDGKLYKLDSSGTEAEVGGSSAGGINYILNPDAESGTTGWAAYALTEAVTFTDAGDTVTLNSHGLQNGNVIAFTVITSTTGISIATAYYVVTATTNTFQVAATSGGAALPLTTNGSGTMVRSYPLTGTGGSPNTTITRVTTSPLRGAGMFRITKSAGATRMGEGVSYDFTIASADKAKPLNISFEYAPSSGVVAGSDTTSGDYNVWVYDVTNALLIQPAPFKLTGGSGSNWKFSGVFQSASNSTSYRLIVHTAGVTSAAATFDFDNVVVGPQVLLNGSVVTDWQSYTPTYGAGFGTVTTSSAEWRRVGDCMEIRGNATAGTVTGGVATIGLPTGYSHNYLTGFASTILEGTFVTEYAGVSQNGMFPLAIAANPTNVSFTHNNTRSGFTALVGNNVLTNGLSFSWNAKLKIVGWGSNVQMSQDTDTRVVALKRQNSVGTTLTRNTLNTIPFAVAGVDTHGGFLTDTYTVPVPGIYCVAANLMLSTAVAWAGGDYARIAILKNGAVDTDYYNVQAGANTNNVNVELTALLNCVAGDTIKIQLDPHIAGAGTPALNGAASQNSLNIFRLSGPATIAATESISARYYQTAATSLTNGAYTTVNFDTKDWDTHGAVTVAAAWKFTAPAPGKYRVTSTVSFAAHSSATEIVGYVRKNGANHSVIADFTPAAALGNPLVHGSAVVNMLAGDYIDCQVYQNSGSARNTAVTSVATAIMVERIGN